MVMGPSSSMVQDTCLGRMRSWVQIPAASPQTQKPHVLFSFVKDIEYENELGSYSKEHAYKCASYFMLG
jgi:hypothetical protein